MKKLTVLFTILIAVGVVITSTMTSDNRLFCERFNEAMPLAKYKTYTDPDMGYSFAYPSFLQKEQDGTLHKGDVRFAWHGERNIILTCTTLLAHDGQLTKADTIRSGRVKDAEDYLYCAHHARRNGRLYVLTLYYPADCSKGLEGLIYRVKKWQVYPEKLNGLRPRSH